MGGERAAKTLLEPGAQVDHYKVIRRIGVGGMGEVYLARDLRLGRPVALKLIAKAESYMVEQFMLEARATARLNHPNIVTVYDIGEWKGVPYLTLEYLEGHTLAERRRQQAFGAGELVRIGLAIADALAEAHRLGVLHRDLKPSNILFPKDGRLRVVDFGVAKLLVGGEAASAEPVTIDAVVDTAVAEAKTVRAPRGDFHPEEEESSIPTVATPATLVDAPDKVVDRPRVATEDLSIYNTGPLGFAGSPAYMAPEQWEQIDTRATDIWALGVILYEMVCGERPFDGPSADALRYLICSPEPVPVPQAFRDIPADLASCIMRCLSKSPDERPTADEVRALLEPMVHRARHTGSEGNPFRGLLAFTEQHADLFFGRDEEVTAFVERLRTQVIIPVVGPSGAGKSSFIRAGVIPRLREQSQWQVVRMRPGNQPFRTLAARLLANDSTASMVDATNAAPPPSTRSTSTDTGDELQLEDALRAAPGRLAVELGHIADRTGSRVLLFIDQFEEVFTLVEDPVEREAFLDAITSAAADPLEPVRVVFTVRDDFVGRIAVARSAREVLSRVMLLVSPGREALRQTLTGPLEAAGYEFDEPALPDEMIAAVDGEPTSLPLLQFTMRLLWERRDRIGKRLLRGEYEAIGGVGGALAEHADVVIEALDPERIRLARDLLLRLVTAEGTRRVVPRARLLDGLGGEAKDVLDRLVDSRLLAVRRGHAPEEDARVELAHESLIVAWQRLAWWLEDSREERRALGELVQAAELWERRGRRADELWQGDALAEAERTLTRVGERAPDVARAFVAAGAARDAQGALRRRRFRIAALAAMVVATIASLAAAWLLSRKEKIARAAEERAEIERAQVLVESARAAFARRDPLQARAKLRSSLEIRDSVSARGLWWQLAREPLLWRKSIDARVYDMDFTPDGRQLAAAAQSKVVYLFDTASLATRVLQGHGDQVLRVAYTPDGRQLASAAWNGELFLWDLSTGRSRTLTTTLAQTNGLLFTADGRRLLSIGRDGAVHTYDAATGAEGASVPFGQGMTSAALARDRSAFAWIDASGHAHLWRLPEVRPWQEFAREGSFTTAVAVSTERGVLAWGEDDGTVRLFDIASARELRSLTGHTGRISGLAFDRTGERLASLSWDETMRIWEVATGAGRVAPAEAGIFPNSLEFDPSGRVLASGGLVPALWTFDGPASTPANANHQSPVYGLAISPDSHWIASADIDGMVRLVDAKTGLARCMFRGHQGELRAAAIHPDGSLLATAGVDRVIKLWALPSCAPVGGLEGHERRVFDLAFSPDGRWLVSTSEDDTIRLWDFAARKTKAVLRGDPADVQRVAFSPKGDRFATVGIAGNAWLWRLDGHGERIYPGPSASGAAFSPDGSRLGLSGTDGVVRILDLATRRWQEFGGFAGRLYDIQFYPDGRRVVLAASDKTARVLDLATGDRSALVGHDGELNAVKMDPAGRFIVTGGDDWTVRTWSTADGRPLWYSVGFTRTGETFGHRGWATLGPALPAGRAAWREAVEARARSVSSAPGRLCVATWDGRLEAWDLRRDERLFDRPGGGRVLAGEDGCMALAGGEARLHTAAGSRPIASGASAIAVDGSGWLVAAKNEIVALAADGKERVRLGGGVGATALLRVGGSIVIGYQDGIVERRGSGAPLLMDETPSSPVMALIAGPAPGTMVAGFANGTLGVWDVASGMRLERMQLHGPVIHLAMDQGRLDAATDLGDQAAYDLGVFRSDYCDLLRDVWHAVPTRWEEGAPRTRAPAAGHRCAR